MLSTDRPEFELQFATLCAGFNVPSTAERKDAFWTGLKNMALLQFVRSVEFALGEHGPEKFPTPKQMWRIHREAKSQTTQVDQAAPRIEQQDHLLYFANRMFTRHIVNRDGLGSVGRFTAPRGVIDCVASEEFVSARNAVRDLVEWFSVGIREGDPDATPRAFVDMYIKALGRVSKIRKSTLDGWAQMAAHEDGALPFEPYMGRELQAEQTRLQEIA